MKRFATLFKALDESTKTTVKIDALVHYFKEAPEQDRIWIIAILSGRRPKRAVTTGQLRAWAAEVAGIPLWLFEESYPIVGDLAETIALVLPPPDTETDHSLTYWIELLRELPQEEDTRKQAVLNAWNGLNLTQRFLFNKLITGGFRVGVSQKLMTRALAIVTEREESEMAHRLMGAWSPTTITWRDLIEVENSTASASKPFPFCLSHALDTKINCLGSTSDWQAEWKWDGIRGQLIVRDSELYIWSRGEELVTHIFPELVSIHNFIPQGTVLDGELLAWGEAGPKNFNTLQKRLGRRTVSKKLLQEAPVIFYAYDLLEWQSEDIRHKPLNIRRKMLEQLFKNPISGAPIKLSPTIEFDTWASLAKVQATARAEKAEGLMLKRKDGPYLAGRKKGNWWKWKLDPLTIDAVMIYAKSGHGRRANLFTDLTFAVWSGNDLVPFTKAYSGLTDAEFRKITSWVKKNTLERFGPVRSVSPHFVFEIAFEGIQASKRHKSGIALRFPRIARWRHDKSPHEANSLTDLKQILENFI